MFLSNWRGGGRKNRKQPSESRPRKGKRSPLDRRRLSLESLEQRHLLTGQALGAIPGLDANAVSKSLSDKDLYVPLLAPDTSQTVSYLSLSATASMASLKERPLVETGSGAIHNSAVTTTADLSTSINDQLGGLSSGQIGTVAAGNLIRYSILVSNNGPSDVTGASLVDDFPSSLSDVTYTTTGNATGFAASGSGNIDDTDLTIPANGYVLYQVQALVSPFAKGTLSDTATATVPNGVTDPNPANNTATDSDTITPVSGLTISTTDNLGGSSFSGNSGTAVPGAAITYTVVISNPTASASAATVIDMLPSGISSATYTATETGGASGFTTSGSGNIDDADVEMPAGSTITYIINATVVSSATGSFTNTATVSSIHSATVGVPLVAGLSSPAGIAVSNGNVFVVNPAAGTVGEYTTSGTLVKAALVSGLSDPTGIAVSGSDLFIVEGNGTIGEYTTAGAVVNASLITGLGTTDDVAASGSDLFVLSAFGTVGEYTTAGALINSSLIGGEGHAAGIAISGSDLFVETFNGTIAEYTTSGTTVNASLITGLSNLAGLALSGGDLFVSNYNGTIGEYTISGATINASLVTVTNYLAGGFLDDLAVSGGEIFAVIPDSGTIVAFPAAANSETVTDFDGLNPKSDINISTTDNLGGSSFSGPIGNGPIGTAAPGGSITYTIVVSNNGPSDAIGALVQDTLPSSLSGATYTATETGGASGFTATGAGNIDDTGVDMPAGSTITYTVKANISPSASGTLANSATVTAPNVTPVNASLVTGLSRPSGIAFSGGGMFVVNSEAGTIGEYYTFGSALNRSLITGLNDPSAIAVSGSDLFVTCQGSGTVAEYTNSGVLVKAALVTGLDGPRGIAISGGDLFVTLANDTIGEFSAATGAAINASLVTGLSQPGGITVSGGDIFVANYGSGTIGEYTTSGATVNAALVTGLSQLTDVTVSGDDLFVTTGDAVAEPADDRLETVDLGATLQTNDTIGEYTLSGATINAALVTGLADPTSITVSGSDLFVANYDNGTVGEYTTGSNSATDTDTLTPGAFYTITTTDNRAGTAVPGQSITYTIVVTNNGPGPGPGATIVDTLPSTLRNATYTATETGGVTGFTANGTGAIDDTDVNMPAGSTVTYTLTATIPSSATGTLANTATVNNTPGATIVTPVAAGLGSPQGIAISGSDVFVADSTTGTISEYTTSGATVNAALIIGLSTPAGGPDAIAVSGGDLFITNDATDTIAEYTTSGVLVNAVLVSGLDGPRGIAISGGDLFVTADGVIAEYTTAGALVTASLVNGLSTVTGLAAPSGIVASGGNLFVANYDGSVSEYTTSGAIVNAALVTGLNETPGIAVSGGDLFVTSAGDNTISEYTTSGALVSPSVVTGLTFPYAIAASGANFFVSTFGGALAILEYPTAGHSTSVTDADTLTPESDVEITKSDNVGGSSVTGAIGLAPPGSSITYAVVVANHGPSDAKGALVVDTLPSSLTGATYKAVATGGAAGFTASGTGSIDDTDVDIPAGSTITYTVHATVSSSTSGTFSNTATVTAPTVTPVAVPLVEAEATAMALSGNNLFVLNGSTGTIGEYNATTGATINARLISGLNDPADITISGNDLYVVNYGAGTIGEYTTAGAMVNAALVSGLTQPAGIAVSGGDLFVTSTNPQGGIGFVNDYPGVIGEYNATTGATINAALISGLSSPGSIAISGNDLFVATTYTPYGLPDTSGVIGEYTTSGETVNATLIGLPAPSQFALSGGDLFVGISGNTGPFGVNGTNTVAEYTTSGATINASLFRYVYDPTVAVSGSYLYVATSDAIDKYTTGSDSATDTDTTALQGPSVTNATTTENTQTTSGLVIKPGAGDSSAAYFQITYITGGTLYQNNSTTPITNGSFITLAQGEAGLKFTPNAGSLVSGGFTVRESTTNTVAGLSGPTARAAIAVTLSGTTVTGATTTENVQTTSGLVIKPETNDSSAAYFQITAITGGTLYQNNGTTQITNGSFITLAQAEAGLKFTPTTGSLAVSGFLVQESTTSAATGLSGRLAWAPIAVTLSKPIVTNATTAENRQTTSGLVITPGAKDSSAAFFQITFITGGTLYQNDGITPIGNGSFITLAQVAAGLKFTPNAGSRVAGGFTVRQSTTNATSGLSGPTARAAITVT